MTMNNLSKSEEKIADRLNEIRKMNQGQMKEFDIKDDINVSNQFTFRVNKDLI